MKKNLTEEEIDQIVADWHNRKIKTEFLHEALGWTLEEYIKWFEESIKSIKNEKHQ